MTTHVLQAHLPRPDALDHAAWEAIQDSFNRLKSAVAADDRPLIVGSTKELVEATARAVLDARGHLVGSDEKFENVLGQAHKAIEHQPGPDLAADALVRQAAAHAKKLATLLRGLRNTYGTGHGRASLPVIEDEILETCVDGALLWTRWALRRLQFLILGSLQPLINDLRKGTFGMGELGIRLKAANLKALDPDDQRLLGVTVGQRAARNTFTVRIDGVEACAASQDDVAWPLGYREGVAEGLFLDQVGQVRVDERVLGPRLAAEVLGPHPDQIQVLKDLQSKLETAAWSTEFTRLWRAVVAEMQRICSAFQKPEAEAVWSSITDLLRRRGEDYEALY